MIGKFWSHVIVRMPNGVDVASTTTPFRLTVWITVYMVGFPQVLLFGYQSVGLATVSVWSNVAAGGATVGSVFAGAVGSGAEATVFESWVLATTLPWASTIWVSSVTAWSDAYSLRTLVCTRMTADVVLALTVDTYVPQVLSVAQVF